jgi:hypothetical protein
MKQNIGFQAPKTHKNTQNFDQKHFQNAKLYKPQIEI